MGVWFSPSAIALGAAHRQLSHPRPAHRARAAGLCEGGGRAAPHGTAEPAPDRRADGPRSFVAAPLLPPGAAMATGRVLPPRPGACASRGAALRSQLSPILRPDI